jgi:hypothetical protein
MKAVSLLELKEETREDSQKLFKQTRERPTEISSKLKV